MGTFVGTNAAAVFAAFNDKIYAKMLTAGKRDYRTYVKTNGTIGNFYLLRVA